MQNSKNIYAKFIFLVVFLFWSFENQSKEINIILKIENEIITNVDIESEYNYLTSLNKQFQNIEKKKIFEFAKESLTKEIIKKIEVSKYYELNQENEMINIMIEKIYQNLEISSEEEFKNYLEIRGLSFDEVYKKIEIEAVWNQMIYTKYKDRLILDKEKIKRDVENNSQTYEVFLLRELIYDVKNSNEIQSKYKKIIESINNIGFNETVINYSIADSKNNFGSLGWINKNALSNKIRKEIEILEIGEISKPIKIPAGILILKIEEKKIEKKKFDLETEINNAIQFETNTQLNNYSTLYFNKIKNNLKINEY